MTVEIKKFLEQQKNIDRKQYFLLNKFYFFPNNSLGGNEENTLEKYYNYGDIKNLLLNNTFFQFLQLCMNDLKFNDRLDYNLLRKIRYLLCDSLDFKKKYIPDLEEEYLRKFCRNEVPIGPIYCKKYNTLELYGLIDHYQKYGFMYEIPHSRDKKDILDPKLIEQLIWENGWKLDLYYEKYIKPTEERNLILKIIETDNYNDQLNCFLAMRNGHDKKSFLSLVCNNEFLTILQNTLLKKELPNTVIDNVIEILEIGINFKTRNDVYEDFSYLYQALGEQLIKEFDYKRASHLITLLSQKKKKSKIVRYKKGNNKTNK